MTASWKIEKQSEGYLITGADGHTVKTNENLAIPVKGKITVRIGPGLTATERLNMELM